MPLQQDKEFLERLAQLIQHYPYDYHRVALDTFVGWAYHMYGLTPPKKSDGVPEK